MAPSCGPGLTPPFTCQLRWKAGLACEVQSWLDTHLRAKQTFISAAASAGQGACAYPPPPFVATTMAAAVALGHLHCQGSAMLQS